MTHPRIKHAAHLQQPAGTAAELGYRMPAEWEPHSAVWVTRPHNVETWPVVMDRALAQFEAWLDVMSRYVPVCTTQAMEIATNDSWIRDYGPIFVVRDGGQGVEGPRGQGEEEGPSHQATEPSRGGQARGGDDAAGCKPQAASRNPQAPSSANHSAPRPLDLSAPSLALHDFHFNGWGGKYEARNLDDVVPQHIARHLQLPIWIHDFILEGGSIDVNGRGSVLTTEQCLLNVNRNAQMSREQIEAKLHETLGTHHVIWLPGGIEGDDTDGHIDDVARFVTADTVVAVRPRDGHPDRPVMERNWQALERARDQDGAKLTLIELPAPEPITFDYPADRFGPGGCCPLPASYANFLITNGAVFVPVFGQASDEPALQALEQALPEHTLVPVRSEWLIVGLGALHCLSQQQPAPIAQDGV